MNDKDDNTHHKATNKIREIPAVGRPPFLGHEDENECFHTTTKLAMIDESAASAASAAVANHQAPQGRQTRSRTHTVNMATGEMMSPVINRKIYDQEMQDPGISIIKNPSSPVPSMTTVSSTTSSSLSPTPNTTTLSAERRQNRKAPPSSNSPVPSIASSDDSSSSFSPGPRISRIQTRPGAVSERSGNQMAKEYLRGSVRGVMMHQSSHSSIPSAASSDGSSSLSPGPSARTRTRPGAVSERTGNQTAKEYLRGSVRDSMMMNAPSTRKMPPSMPSIPANVATASTTASRPGAFAEKSATTRMNSKQRLNSTSNMLSRNQQAASSQKYFSQRSVGSTTTSNINVDDDDGPEIMADEHDDAMLQRTNRRVTPQNNGLMARSVSARNPVASRMASSSTLVRSISATHPGAAAAAAANNNTSLARAASNRSAYVGDNPRFRNASARQGMTLPTNNEDDAESVWSNDSSGSLKPGVVAISREGEESFYGVHPSKGQFTRLHSSQAVLSTSFRNSDDGDEIPTVPPLSGRSNLTASHPTSTRSFASQSTLRSHAADPDAPMHSGADPTAAAESGADNIPEEAVVDKQQAESSLCSCSKNKVIAFALLIVVAAGAAVGVILSQQSSPESPSSGSLVQNETTTAPSAAPRNEERFNDLVQVIKTISDEVTLRDSASPQSQTLEWLSFQDPDQLEISDDELEQRYLLALFYFAMTGDNWFDSSSFLTAGNSCNWKGITCDSGSASDSASVIAIQLERNNLKGSIPAEICNFSSLQRMYLSGNQVQGSLPQQIGNCTNLFELGLAGNQLSSTLPEEIGLLSNLVEIGLENNQLEGKVPTAIGRLSNLAILSLSRNSLTGTLPTEMGRLSNLESLLLQSCRLEGLPSQLENLSKMNRIDLGDNLLDGSIPSWLAKLTGLVQLKIDFNQFSSSIPAELGDLTALEILWLSHNDITGQVPSELSNLVNLGDVQFHQTELSGDFNGIFCTADSSPLTLTADCAGVNPNVNCTCCSSCF